MAVSKRTRYEVLRRDDFKCRYCGLAGPEGAGLTIDHVTPLSLGGSDHPANLVAACKDCNAGKASSNPDAPLVAQVSDDAVRWASAMKAAADAMLQRQGALDGTFSQFEHGWAAWDPGLNHIPPGWRNSVEAWVKAGLPMELLLPDIDKAWSNQRVPPREVFRYMAGIAWKQVTELQEAARASVAPEASPLATICAVCWATEDPEDGPCDFGSAMVLGRESWAGFRWCGRLDCEVCHAKFHGYDEGLPEGYGAGHTAGYNAGWVAADAAWCRDRMPGALLRGVVDGTFSRKFGQSYILDDPGMTVPLVIDPAPTDPWAA